MSKVLNYILLIFLWGSLIGYSLVSYEMIDKLIMPAITSWFDLQKKFTVSLVQLGIVLVLATATLPFTWKNDLSARFASISKYIFVFVLYLIVLMAVQCASYRSHFENKHTPKYSMFKWNVTDMVRYYGNFLYGFNCLAGVFTMTNQLKKQRHSGHIRKIYLYTTVCLYVIFAAVGVIGYISLGNDSADYDLIILRPPLGNSKDIPMKVGWLLVGLTNLICFVMYSVSWKIQFKGFFGFQMTNCRNFLITVAVVYLPFVVGWSYPYATKIFGIIGGIFGTILMTTFPGMLYLAYLAQTGRKWSFKYWAMLVWCTASTLLGMASGGVLIADLFKKA